MRPRRPAGQSIGSDERSLRRRRRALGLTTIRLETNRALDEAIALYRSAGYRETAPFNDEAYADHWFEKTLR